MINPDIFKEYGDEGGKVIERFSELLTDEERNTVYLVDHHQLSNVAGAPFEVTTTRPELVDPICLKVMNFYLNIEPNTIVVCDKYKGEGIKLWLTS